MGGHTSPHWYWLLLARRPLDSHLSRRVQTVAADQRDRTIQLRFSRRRCIVAIALAFGDVSYNLVIFQRTFVRESAVREYLKKRDRSVEKIPH